MTYCLCGFKKKVLKGWFLVIQDVTPDKWQKKLFSSILLLPLVISVAAQNDLKSWNSAKLDLSLSKKLDLRFSHLRSYNISNGFSSDFNQTSIYGAYDITKRFSMSTGVILGSLSAADGANRFVLRGTYRVPVGGVLNWSNAVQGEIHSANETRYRNRVIYITRLSTRRRLDFLNLSPSVSYSLYYNIGGNPIQYYDKNEVSTVKQTPDGFHRGRLLLNLNSRFNTHFSLSLYYMMQREFNLFTDDYHKINVVDPVSGNTVRRFQDYNVIGTTLSFDFKLYKKKNKTTRNTEDFNN